MDDLQEPAICDECGRAYYGNRCRSCDSEYERGRVEAELRSIERKIYGNDLCEQWEIEQEMREDY